MKKLSYILCCLFAVDAFAADTGLGEQLQKTKNACSGISEQLGDLKTRAGINTALTGVGTVAGGVALGTGLAKASVDADIEKIEKSLKELEEKQRSYEGRYNQIMISGDLFAECETLVSLNKNISDAYNSKSDMQAKIDAATDKSKSLGNVRTGAMAGAAVTDTVGTILAAGNRVDDTLQSKIESCVRETNNLQNAYNVARAENTADEATLQKAVNVMEQCGAWSDVDLSSINDKSKGAAISGGTGAALALAGMITSASANSESVRSDDTDEGKAKEKNLNTASNILAGGTSAASLVSTVFSATQISAIKKAASVAEKCEEALQ